MPLLSAETLLQPPATALLEVKNTNNNFELEERLYTPPRNPKPCKTLKSNKRKCEYNLNYKTLEKKQKVTP